MTNTLLDPNIGPLEDKDLQYDYPIGVAPGDNPDYRGYRDKRLLNRHERYEVRYFSNEYELSLGLINQPLIPGSIALKVERLLHLKVPKELTSRLEIKDWLRRNWDFFPNV